MTQTIPIHLRPFYNEAVERAFNGTVIVTEHLLGSLESDFARSYYERIGTASKPDSLIREIVSPFLYLRLSCEPDGVYAIRFGIEPLERYNHLTAITVQFLRTLMEFTADRNLDPGFERDIDIEDCIRTDWFINCCSDLFEHVDSASFNHTLKTVPYEALVQ